MIHVHNLGKSFGPQDLLTGLSWNIPAGQRIGLVGANGAGKSTLLRILAGEQQADSGHIDFPPGTTVGHLHQEVAVSGDHSALDEVLRGRPELVAYEREMEEIQQRLASPAGESQQLAARLGELEALYSAGGGYTLRSDARSILSGMGFTASRMDQPLPELSGGWQMRAVLSRLLLSRPDLLLMDEPTNHLDVPSVEWLEGFLRNYPGTTIIVSHDRFFLNRMVTTVAELAQGKITLYTGNWDQYVIERQERRERLAKAAEQQRKEVARTERFIERFRYKNTKAKQVQSRVKALEKLERIELPQERRKRMNIPLPEPPRSGKVVMTLRHIAKRYGDNVVYDGLDFVIERGERVALVGPNGEGKSTLLKILADVIDIDDGEREEGHNVAIAYFAQHQVDALDLDSTVLREMESAASADVMPRVRSILGAFLFSGESVDKRVSVLSGGEKSRLALAKLMLSPANLLLFDEPTNHLDIPSRDVLEGALRQFAGTICFISHDRHFINGLASRVVHIEAKQALDYIGNYDDYHRRRSNELAAQAEDEDRPTENVRRADKRRRAEARRALAEAMGDRRERLAEIEADLARCEARQGELEALMADPSLYDNGNRAGEVARDAHAIGVRLDELMSRWESLAEEVEAIEAEFAEQAEVQR